MTPSTQLAIACAVLVLLTFVVGVRLLYERTMEMREKRVHPQAAANSLQMAAKLHKVQAADNFRNLFETPVMFYALVGIAIGIGYTPAWLALGAWVYVALRVAHSAIHCSYNKVMHRFAAFGAGFLLLIVLWTSFAWSLAARTTA